MSFSAAADEYDDELEDDSELAACVVIVIRTRTDCLPTYRR
jgi:hypothetical protein